MYVRVASRHTASHGRPCDVNDRAKRDALSRAPGVSRARLLSVGSHAVDSNRSVVPVARVSPRPVSRRRRLPCNRRCASSRRVFRTTSSGARRIFFACVFRTRCLRPHRHRRRRCRWRRRRRRRRCWRRIVLLCHVTRASVRYHLSWRVTSPTPPLTAVATVAPLLDCPVLCLGYVTRVSFSYFRRLMRKTLGKRERC